RRARGSRRHPRGEHVAADAPCARDEPAGSPCGALVPSVRTRRIRATAGRLLSLGFPPGAANDPVRRCMSGKQVGETTLDPQMGYWYTIGVALGLGTALGVLFAGLLSATALGRVAAVVLAGAAGALAGARIEDWTEVGGGAIGGLVGAVGAALGGSGARGRGGA